MLTSVLDALKQGGFSYVYLVEDTSAHSLYALKKIRCPFGQESVALALKEVEAYALFQGNQNIIHAVDHSVATERGAEEAAKTVYILLPYFRRGNLQDAINANLVNRTRFPEKRLMVLFLGVCKALKAMHQYRVPTTGSSAEGRNKASAKRIRDEAARADEEARLEVDGDEEEQPLVDGEVTMAQEGVAPGSVRSYAHRDVKPGKSLYGTSLLAFYVVIYFTMPSCPTKLTFQRQHHDI